MTIVTVSASYGAGGSAVGPRVAERLCAAFVDRAIPVQVARDLGLSQDEADELAANAGSRWSWLLHGMAGLSYGMSTVLPDEGADDEGELLRRTEAHLREQVAAGDCVILGHAAAVVFAGRPDALHVRMDGSVDGRIEAAMHQHGIDRDAATAALKANDKLRSGYVRHFYGRDADDPSLYDLRLDSVRLGWQQVADLIVHAAGLGERAAVESAPGRT